MNDVVKKAIMCEQEIVSLLEIIKNNLYEKMSEEALQLGRPLTENTCVVSFRELVRADNLCPNTYVGKAQAEAVFSKISKASSVTMLKTLIDTLTEEKKVKTNAYGVVFLNEKTIHMLTDFKEQYLT